MLPQHLCQYQQAPPLADTRGHAWLLEAVVSLQATDMQAQWHQLLPLLLLLLHPVQRQRCGAPRLRWSDRLLLGLPPARLDALLRLRGLMALHACLQQMAGGTLSQCAPAAVCEQHQQLCG